MNGRNFSITALLLVIILIAGCRSTKRIQTAIAKKDTSSVSSTNTAADSAIFIRNTFNRLQQNRIDFRTFSAKVKVDFEGSDGKRSDFNAFVRLKKDSILWVSINAALGIEAFRVLITPDSVKVLNKLDKIAQLRSVSYLQEVTKLPLTFTDLQNLIIGNPVFLDSNIISYKNEDQSVSLMSVGEFFKHFITAGTPDLHLEHSKLDDVDPIRARTADIRYSKYENKNGIRFSTLRKITVSEKTKLDLELDYKQFDFNVELNFPFTVPRNYKLK
ncbi:MAG TPA: DUF4292 domain-containing protein [Flavitalea sp.]|nr:DUF4292 domain-containing protein [Flavitalea sp.]